ncbi:replication protein RepA (plasmid) [Buchnera aphidicola (Thelaxes californica)]|uniref:Replication protein RepA n=1 Tax=Buchnera aphidicola (Thelaxes californica) TaxID=1315998 RepID=A0A4D6YCF3_9GAMM|nr:plasmid replication initiator RepA [Buchnera aphidicola]QCI27009.1 replication protein RepA [Buchnera aphidicola (Thelaxes californica)]
MSKRKNYINNLYPIFTPPKRDKKRPYFIRYAMKKASEIDVARGVLHYTIQPKNPHTGVLYHRSRRLNEHRACAMRAMVLAMIYHFNLSSEIVQASVEQLSDECGLSTISKAGNKSITRASRLITHFMEPMGFVKCEKKWDSILNNYMPKMITLTPLFFLLFEVPKIKLQKAKMQQLGWINKQLIEKGFQKISPKEAKKRGKDQRIRGILKYRESRYSFLKKRRKAKLMLSLEEKDAKQKILRLLVKEYSISELIHMGAEGLKKQVNIEYFYLKKLVSSPYPDIP